MKTKTKKVAKKTETEIKKFHGLEIGASDIDTESDIMVSKFSFDLIVISKKDVAIKFEVFSGSKNATKEMCDTINNAFNDNPISVMNAMSLKGMF